MVTVAPDVQIQMSHESSILPNITSAIYSANAQKKEEFIRTQLDNLNLGNMLEVSGRVCIAYMHLLIFIEHIHVIKY